MKEMTNHGYLVIGDISGYTSYVASTELLHSQAVLSELLDLLVDRIKPFLSLVKLEGDAIFAHAPQAQIRRGESLLELIESTYVAFRDRVAGIRRQTTCECNACRAIPTLDLKFLVHFGEYYIQHVSGIDELVGSDVNLLHRLTKNQVSESTGWHAYACFTHTALEHLGMHTNGMHEQIERYEHLGEVLTYSLDLRERYKEIAESRQIFITAEDADATLTMDVVVPPAMLWAWLTEPEKRNQYMRDVTWSSAVRSGGRTGVGSQNHCAHGKDATLVETILDWKPFEYYTVQINLKSDKETMMDSVQTIHLQPINGGFKTRLNCHVMLKKSNLIPRMISKFSMRSLRKNFQAAARLAQEEMAVQESGNPEL